MLEQAFRAGYAGPVAEEAPPAWLLDGKVRRPSLQVHVLSHGGAVVVGLCGVAGIVEAADLRRQLVALAEKPVPVIVLDLTDLAFIGASGLTAIVCAYLRSRRHGGEIRLAAPQPAVLGVLERTRLTTRLPVYGSVTQALAGSAA